ncbi:MAG TPA: hypothetical protein VFR24_14590 [Candidatus Angelobacter sp.]|nr:hypothetical protein [Candidatus Angelobacter sp.]
MDTKEEFEQRYREQTQNYRPRMTPTTAPDFRGDFRKAFAEIDDLLVQEVK